ncbi:helix-turn-helix domain-containing protein, partial [Phaeobacter sp. HF9A]|uniref:helix-turn-helix domain-containing protein n=1 Tax=Phaeobacter sp. HF9A TaxID=2721561 RepID=UPI001431F713
MPTDSLTGSRIRERRMVLGLRQADLAREVGISASYLNLIEHNRRRIGGKLLVALAQVLGVEASTLTDGVEATLIAALREAAADSRHPLAELDRVDEFAGRFPGWAEVLSDTHGRVGALERTVRGLSDRLTHDPHLAASLHEVLSTAAAIRSTAAILAEPGELEAEWRDRFHRNLDQDAQRLADSSRALVRFLDDSEASSNRKGTPQEELEAFFAARGYHFPDLEAGKVT